MKENPPRDRGPRNEGWRRYGRAAILVHVADLELLGRQVQEVISTQVLGAQAAIVGGFHSVTTVVKSADAAIEGARFQSLQKPGKEAVVEKRRKKIDDVYEGLEHEETVLEERLTKWREMVDGNLKELNKEIGAKLDLHLTWYPKTFDALMVEIDDALNALKEANGAYMYGMQFGEDFYRYADLNHATSIAYEQVLEFRKQLVATWEAKDTDPAGKKKQGVSLRELTKRAKETRRKAAKAIEGDTATPEGIALRRERFLQERDEALSATHGSLVRVTTIERKVAEKRDDVRELLGGRDPRIARAKKEEEGRAHLFQELDDIAYQARLFTNRDTLRQGIEQGVQRASELGRQPLVRDLQLLVAKTRLPEDIRYAMEDYLNFFYAYGPIPEREVRALRSLLVDEPQQEEAILEDETV